MEEFLKEKKQQFLGYETLIMKTQQKYRCVVILSSDKRAVLPIKGSDTVIRHFAHTKEAHV